MSEFFPIFVVEQKNHMKNLIVIFGVIIGMMISVSANAQYVVRPIEVNDSTLIQNLNDSYISTLSEIKRAKQEFFAGVGVQVLGVMTYLVPVITEVDDDVFNGCMCLGTIFTAAGAFFEIHGGYKWLSSANKLRDIRVTAQANGLVVYF